jgi:2-polyprenyl-6-methoxyphenol hydroxylase-like FAD-dependent oxidoreductase
MKGTLTTHLALDLSNTRNCRAPSRQLRLEGCVREADAIELRLNVNVTLVENESDQVVVTASTGETWPADAVIGADGVHSTVRRFVDPDHFAAACAGFMLWRVMVSEQFVKNWQNCPVRANRHASITRTGTDS